MWTQEQIFSRLEVLREWLKKRRSWRNWIIILGFLINSNVYSQQLLGTIDFGQFETGILYNQPIKNMSIYSGISQGNTKYKDFQADHLRMSAGIGITGEQIYWTLGYVKQIYQVNYNNNPLIDISNIRENSFELGFIFIPEEFYNICFSANTDILNWISYLGIGINFN